jgi:hypothetical protein
MGKPYLVYGKTIHSASAAEIMSELGDKISGKAADKLALQIMEDSLIDVQNLMNLVNKVRWIHGYTRYTSCL